MTIHSVWTDPVHADYDGPLRTIGGMEKLLESLEVERQDRTFWRLPATAAQQAAQDRAVTFANLTEAEAVPVRVAELLAAVESELHEIEDVA